MPKLPLFDADFVANPFPYWSDYRSNAPVFWSEEYRFWVVSRHADVEAMLMNPATFSSASGPGGGLRSAQSNESAGDVVGFLPMIQNDPPEHTRLRALLSRSFSSSRIAGLEPGMHALARELLAKMDTRLQTGETADLFADFASPLPVAVIAQLLGIPAEFHRRLHLWNQTLGVSGAIADAGTRTGMNNEMNETLALLIEQKRTRPADDLISSLVSIADEGGTRLRTDELLGFCKLLWIAGNETTTNLICNTALFLQSRPELLQRLRADKTLIAAFVEEALRLEGPVSGLFRRVTADTDYQGNRLKAGDNVWLLYGSANRDESQHANAGDFIIEREANQHLAFGKGIHFCMGAPLARMEARVAFEHLIDMLPTLRIRADLGRRIPIPVLRGWLSLPVTRA